MVRFKTSNSNSMEQSPSWEVYSSSARQEITRILWKSKVLYLIHKGPPPFPIVSQINPVRAPRIPVLKIHFNITSPLRLRPPSGLFP
jgi:hypothetical protein